MKIKIEQLVPGTEFRLNNSGINIPEFKLKSTNSVFDDSICDLDFYPPQRFIVLFKRDSTYATVLPKLEGIFQENYPMFTEHGTLVDVD